jgi:hypothetical protein
MFIVQISVSFHHQLFQSIHVAKHIPSGIACLSYLILILQTKEKEKCIHDAHADIIPQIEACFDVAHECFRLTFCPFRPTAGTAAAAAGSRGGGSVAVEA